MAKLKNELKVLIVRMLARYSSHREVQSRIQEDYGIYVPHNQLAYYNPVRDESTKLSTMLRELFYRERDAFLNDTSDLPLTKKDYRIRELCKMAERVKNVISETDKQDKQIHAIRIYTDTIMKIDKLMESDHKAGEREPREDDIRPTLKQINNYIYFDK